MIDQITLLLAAPIAKSILEKFYEGIGSKLGEKAIEKAFERLPEKVKQLGQLIWEKCLRRTPGSREVLERAANGSVDDQKQLTEYLHSVLKSDSTLEQEVKQIADEIHQVIQFDDVNARNIQQVFGGQGLQVIDPKSHVFQAGDNAVFNFGIPQEH